MDQLRLAEQAILGGIVDTVDDLARERSQSSVDVEQVAAALAGGIKKLEKRRQTRTYLKAQPWARKEGRYFMSREEMHLQATVAGKHMWTLIYQNEKDFEWVDSIHYMRFLFDMAGPIDLHSGLFLPCIMQQGSEEQKAKWLPMAKQFRIVGAYAQTELGHGSYVRGIQTVAVFDKATQEFVLHSPTLTAAKWWPGALAKSATHAALMARLFLDGKDYGPHPFLVQLRDLDTRRSLPGREMGDMGEKFGYNAVDNGYLRLTHVRIPRENMLMRFAGVTPEGKYLPPPKDFGKASYATLVLARMDIARWAGWYLAKAVTIAVRYTAVRRQTVQLSQPTETQVLDYGANQAAVLHNAARAYGLIFVGERLLAMYMQFEEAKDQRNDFSMLPELHGLTAGFKVRC